jgi:hypothetical protein
MKDYKRARKKQLQKKQSKLQQAYTSESQLRVKHVVWQIISGKDVMEAFISPRTHQSLTVRPKGSLPDSVNGVEAGRLRHEATRTKAPAAAPQPPLNAEFILHLLLNKDEQDAIIGDLIERYGSKARRMGVRRANLWFYMEIARTTWPLLKRIAVRASGLIALGEWVRRHVS